MYDIRSRHLGQAKALAGRQILSPIGVPANSKFVAEGDKSRAAIPIRQRVTNVRLGRLTIAVALRYRQ